MLPPHPDLSLIANISSLPRRWGGGAGINLAALDSGDSSELLWPCTSWPAPREAFPGLTTELLRDRRRSKRLAALLKQQAGGIDAELPSFIGSDGVPANFTCPSRSEVLAFLNSTLAPFDRPRIVPATATVDGAEVVLLAERNGRAADTILLEIPARGDDTALLAGDPTHGGKLRAATARGSLSLWSWWWGPWRWHWRHYYRYWSPPKLTMQLFHGWGAPLPDRILSKQERWFCYRQSHWYIFPMVYKMEAIDGNVPQCSFRNTGYWRYSGNGRVYFWNWCACVPAHAPVYGRPAPL